MSGYFVNFILFIYSILMQYVAINILKLISLISPKIKEQLKPRNSNLYKNLLETRRKYKHCMLFYCSSAGEYEQSKPLIDLYMKNKETFVHVLFFSVSGIKYMQAKTDNVSYSLAPLDTLWHCSHFFSVLKPNYTFINRYELWPAFIFIAKNYSKLILFNLSFTSSKKRIIYRYYLNYIYKYFYKIFVVNQEDKNIFNQDYPEQTNQLVISGDTKYDRVFQLAHDNSIKTQISEEFSKYHSKNHIIIFGSVYYQDLEIILLALTNMKTIFAECLLIFAPHETNDTQINKSFKQIENKLNQFNLNIEKYSELSYTNNNCDIVLIDKLGILAQVYSIANLAYIGGAVHNKVHNVLEPAAYGIHIASGENYSNSKEAIFLQQNGLLSIIKTPIDLTAFIQNKLNLQDTEKNIQTIEKLCGATDLIFNNLERE